MILQQHAIKIAESPGASDQAGEEVAANSYAGGSNINKL
jgi:hypothetical protein